MALPTRGQADWDDELANHVAGMEADIASANARSVVAASDATYARNKLDEVIAGASSALTLLSGATIDLDNGKPDGFLVGYRVVITSTIEGTAFPPGSYIFERDSTVYGGWTYRVLDAGTGVVPAPDTTAPTVGTLASSSITATTATVTVTGAADETALHAAPYSFSKDNGATWTAYQSSNVYNWTGLTGSTAYQMRHRTKDAAGNVSTGAAITVNTSAPSGWSTKLHDTFTSDGNLTGKTPDTVGTATWTTPATTLTVASGLAREISSATGGRNRYAITPGSSTRIRATMDFKGAPMPDTSASEITIEFPNTPAVKIINTAVSINGYNASAVNTTLMAAVTVPNTAGVGQITAEREGNELRVFSGATLLGSVTLAYSGYTTGWSPTFCEISGWKTTNAYIDSIKAELYT